MTGKDIHSEVEGHGTVRVKRSDDGEPETTDPQSSTDEPEVEGQAVRGHIPPVAEVEGHLARGKGRNDEAPESPGLTGADDEPEVEGQCIRGK